MARLTKKQALLKVLHGSVDEFTDKCILAIGDISKDEAVTAIRDYRKLWDEAGWSNKERDDGKEGDPILGQSQKD